MATSEELRVSDGERDRVVELLKEHTAQGRLSLEELEERTGAAYAAKTRRQLQPLTQDLPAAADFERDQREPIAGTQHVPTRTPCSLTVLACCCGRPGRWRP
jgi:Domain of unknown function (DUF1707)